MIQFVNVSKVYPNGAIALEGVNLEINKEEFVTIVGLSGAGKTTLTKLILGEEEPTEGSVLFENQDISTFSMEELTMLRRRIGTVFQEFRLLANKTAYENIAFAMEAAGKSDDEIVSDVPHVLQLVDLQDRMYHFPSQLSGGEKQRLAIARAIINQPEVLIADEPTGNLDSVSTEEVIHILKKINDLGTTVILATHDQQVIHAVSQRLVTMERGRVISDEQKHHGKGK
ncbi:MAG TPA: cell division ATP-binding protein FtsE [Candidatus Paceibacterota bacterium]|jgi:cell division transport system ATP-binding protein|nr:cell division ATP-binding protein FtsE [Candidatus Paceibacterota bacterium]